MSGRPNPQRATPKTNHQRTAAHAERTRSRLRARKAQATANAEDYVAVISELIAAHGEARVTEVARCLGVSHVTVVRTIARLKRAALVAGKPYQPVELTPAGAALAQHVLRRHKVVLAFLRSLGVSPEAAQADAEGIEHHVSDETLAAMERFSIR
ncbi:MAG: manganese-binding transcriptional regulator MntR [Tepidisphaera sp.]|jgi:DtxR family transcriptional regulator, manganese transport regulator